MRKYDEYSKNARRKNLLVTKFAYKTGVFQVPSGKWIVKVRKGKKKNFTTLSMHNTREEAEEIYNNFKE